MKTGSLISALSQKFSEKLVFGLSGVEESTGKTKEISKLNEVMGQKSVLLITDKNDSKIFISSKNVKGINALTVDQLNAYEVIRHQSLALTKQAVDALMEKLVTKKEKKENA
jgi:large subunit ribosomal protein L4